MANANRSSDGDEDSLLLQSLFPLPNRSLHCAAAATMLSSSKHPLFHPLVNVRGTKRGEKRKRSAPGGGEMKRCVWVGKGFYILVTSTSNTNNLLFSTPSRPSSNRAFVPSKSRLAVATIGREVFCKRRRVSAKPIPREAGLVRIHPPRERGAMILFVGWGLGVGGWGLGAAVYLCVLCVKGRKVERGRGEEGVDSMQRALLDSTAPLRDSPFS